MSPEMPQDSPGRIQPVVPIEDLSFDQSALEHCGRGYVNFATIIVTNEGEISLTFGVRKDFLGVSTSPLADPEYVAILGRPMLYRLHDLLSQTKTRLEEMDRQAAAQEQMQ